MEQTPKLVIITFVLIALAYMNLGLQSPAYSQNQDLNQNPQKCSAKS